jgi:hypothetical protein
MNTYTLVDICQYLELVHVTSGHVRDAFQHFLAENVYRRIHDLDKIVVEITPPSVSIPTTSSTTIHFNSSFSNGSHSISTGGMGGSKYNIMKKTQYNDHKGRRPQHSHHQSGDNNTVRQSKYAPMSGDWNAGKSFKPTKIQTKEGIEKDINEIRVSLNKISNKTYETHRDLILTLVENLIPDPDVEDSDSIHTIAVVHLQRVAQFIFDIASTNKFYGEIYADLYKELVLKFDIFRTILNEFVSTYNETIKTIQYVDSNENYDAYCEYTKTNDRRRATAAFLMLLMNRSVLDTKTMVALILHFQTIFTEYIHIENRANEVDEITEVLFILIPTGKEILSTLPEWNESILPNLMIASKLKAKDLRSLSSRAVFKYMDLVKKVV